jgi:23S rRNA (uracil1939-C5)-methyltransferase
VSASVSQQVGARVELAVTHMGQSGDGVAAAPDGLTLFVRGGLPGERVLAEVTERRAHWGRARLLKVLAPSPDRVAAPCPAFGICGGCAFQHWTYAAELRHKRRRVAEALRRVGGFAEIAVAPVVPAPDPYGYRAKASFAVSGRPGALRIGFYAAGTHRVVPLAECAIQDPLVNRVLAAAGPLLDDLRLPPYDERTGEGVLRHLVVRQSRLEGRAVAMAVVASMDPALYVWADRLMAAEPAVAGVAANVNPDRTNRIEGPLTKPLAGRPVLQEQVLGVRFAVAPDAFFQVNPVQVEVLYRLALDALGPGRLATVLELYAGVGTLTRLLAERADRVEAVEQTPSAVVEGRRNTAGFNVAFYAGAAEDVVPRRVEEGMAPDAAVLDPPRSGARPPVLRALLAARPRRIVYISCRPETLARDLRVLREGYRLESVRPVDMFPRSDHVEVVAALDRVTPPAAPPHPGS